MTRLILALLLGLSLLGCAREQLPVSEGFLLYGMSIQLTLPSEDAARMQAALSEVERIVKAEYALLHPWRDSPLTRLNTHLAQGGWTTLDPALRDIIERSTAFEQQSMGTFSPAIGALVKLWGFHSSTPNQTRSPPEQADIDRLMNPPPRMSDLHIDGERIRSQNPNLLLDFNAIAEGWALEKAAQALHAQGIEHAIIDAGGDLRILGKAGERPWRIAIQDPFGEGALAAIEVEGDQAVFTSGNYRKRFVYRGVTYSHVLDPRSGWPSRGLSGVTVIAEDAVLADAAATALLAAGLKDAPTIARHLGLTRYLLVDERGELYASPELAPRLKLVQPDRMLHVLPR